MEATRVKRNTKSPKAGDGTNVKKPRVSTRKAATDIQQNNVEATAIANVGSTASIVHPNLADNVDASNQSGNQQGNDGLGSTNPSITPPDDTVISAGNVVGTQANILVRPVDGVVDQAGDKSAKSVDEVGDQAGDQAGDKSTKPKRRSVNRKGTQVPSTGVSALEVQEIVKSMLPMLVQAFATANGGNAGNSIGSTQSAIPPRQDGQSGEHIQGGNNSPDGVNDHPNMIDMTDDGDNPDGKSKKQGKTTKKKTRKSGKKSRVTAPQDDLNEDSDQFNFDDSERQKLPTSQLVTWSRISTRIIGSLSVVAKAISLGLAVAATSRLLRSDVVKEGALLLLAAYDEQGDIGMEIYQYLFDQDQPKLFKVASSNIEVIGDFEAEFGIDILDTFDGYWLSRKGWEEVKMLAEQDYFQTTTSVVTPWFLEGTVGARSSNSGAGLKPSFMQMLQAKPAERVLKGNPEWYHRVSTDIILRNKRTEELVNQSGEKALKLCKHPERLEVKGMNIYILDIVSVAPEYARNNPANELCRQFTSKHNCPVCPAITTLVAREWLVMGSAGLRYFEDLNRVYGTNKARLRVQQYQRIDCKELPLNKEFLKLYEEDSKLMGLLELPLAEQATHRYVTLIAMAYQMRLSFQEGLHMAVERLFLFLAAHDLGIQSDAMQQLIVASTYQLFLELDDFRITLTSYGKGDRKDLIKILENIPNLSTSGSVHGLWEHLRVKDNGSAAAMLMKASKSAEENVIANNEKSDDKNSKNSRNLKDKKEGKGNGKGNGNVTGNGKGGSPKQHDKSNNEPSSNMKMTTGNGTQDTAPDNDEVRLRIASTYCANFNSETGCKAAHCIRKHAVPEKGSKAFYFTMKNVKRFGLTPSKELMANQ